MTRLASERASASCFLYSSRSLLRLVLGLLGLFEVALDLLLAVLDGLTEPRPDLPHEEGRDDDKGHRTPEEFCRVGQNQIDTLGLFFGVSAFFLSERDQ